MCLAKCLAISIYLNWEAGNKINFVFVVKWRGLDCHSQYFSATRLATNSHSRYTLSAWNYYTLEGPWLEVEGFFFLRTISWCVFGNGEFTFYCHFCAGISSSRSSTVSFEGSPLSAGGTEGSLISIQYYPNLSSTAPNGPGSESPKYVKIILASNIPLEIAFVCLLHLHI